MGFSWGCWCFKLPDGLFAGFVDALACQGHGAFDIALRQGDGGLAPQAGRLLAARHRGQAQLAVAQRLQRQRGQHALQPLVAALARAQDQQAVGRLGVVMASIRDLGQGFESRHTGLQHGQQLGVGLCGNLAHHHLEQAGANLQQLAQLVGAEFGDDGAAPGQQRGQPLALQDAQCVADRAAADAEFIGQFLLADARARRHGPRKDTVADTRGDLLGDGQRRIGLVGKQPEGHGAFPGAEQVGRKIAGVHGRLSPDG
jgi:hypothetical protein